MRLNNRGWGLREMIVFSSILLILLLFAAYYIYILYNNLEAEDSMQYAKLELKLQTSAALYVSEHNLLEQKAIISLGDLRDGSYIEEFVDYNHDKCNGYVIYDGYEYKSYIFCNKYTTSGYNEIYE